MTTNAMLTHEAAIDAIAEALQQTLGRELTGLDATTSLFNEIGLDSTGVLDLLMALEERLGLAFDTEELEMGHFSTVGSLADYLIASQG